MELVLGVKNLFDADPPQSNTSQNFQTGYDATFTNPLGRTYYVRASYKFF
jgi:iron complex outermembrane receptor protein